MDYLVICDSISGRINQILFKSIKLFLPRSLFLFHLMLLVLHHLLLHVSLPVFCCPGNCSVCNDIHILSILNFLLNTKVYHSRVVHPLSSFSVNIGQCWSILIQFYTLNHPKTLSYSVKCCYHQMLLIFSLYEPWTCSIQIKYKKWNSE